ncbi:hypothetical protein VTG60DRAFT_1821 [Thermothelomyces hinnuleus]
MLRFPPPLPGREPVLELRVGSEVRSALTPAPLAAPRRGDKGLVATANGAGGGRLVGAASAAGAETEPDGSCCEGDAEDSFESGPLRSEAISTMGGRSRRLRLEGQTVHQGAKLCASREKKGKKKRSSPLWRPVPRRAVEANSAPLQLERPRVLLEPFGRETSPGGPVLSPPRLSRDELSRVWVARCGQAAGAQSPRKLLVES